MKQALTIFDVDVKRDADERRQLLAAMLSACAAEFPRLDADADAAPRREILERVVDESATQEEVTALIPFFMKPFTEWSACAKLSPAKNTGEVMVRLRHLDSCCDLMSMWRGLLFGYPVQQEILSAACFATRLAYHSLSVGLLMGSDEAMATSRMVEIQKTYLIRNPKTGLLKIGKAKDIAARIKSLQCGAGVKLDLLAVILDDVEKSLHEKFSVHQEFSEWFSDAPQIRQFFAEHENATIYQ